MVKKGQKQGFFGLFKKIKSLVLSVIGVKRKLLWSFNILWKLHAWKNLVLTSYDQKWLSTNEISIFFNRQYFIYRLMCRFNFWNVDKNEGKIGLSTSFLKKVWLGKLTPFQSKNDRSS